MTDWGKPKHCAECGRKLKRLPAAGRPPVVCGKRCEYARHNRQRREARARNGKRAKNSPVEVAYLNETRHWLRTGQQSPKKPDAHTLVTTWLKHSCEACGGTP